MAESAGAAPFRIKVAPEMTDDGSLHSLLQELDSEAPSVSGSRQERHTQHLWVDWKRLDGHVEKLFVKIYRPPVKRNLLTLFLASRARREYTVSRRAAELELPVVAAIAFGERRQLGVVVDQLVAFRDIGSATTVSRIVKGSRATERTRLKMMRLFAERLADLHHRGYLHLAASPRNLLRIVEAEQTSFRWVDHSAALIFSRSIHATAEAAPDVVHSFEQEVLVRDLADRMRFLEFYAPGAEEFHRWVLDLWNRGFSSKYLRRSRKLRMFWRSGASSRTATSRSPGSRTK